MLERVRTYIVKEITMQCIQIECLSWWCHDDVLIMVDEKWSTQRMIETSSLCEYDRFAWMNEEDHWGSTIFFWRIKNCLLINQINQIPPTWSFSATTKIVTLQTQHNQTSILSLQHIFPSASRCRRYSSDQKLISSERNSLFFSNKLFPFEGNDLQSIHQR